MVGETEESGQRGVPTEKKPFSLGAYRKEQSIKHAQMIDMFVEKRGLERKTYQDKEKIVQVLSPSGDDVLESGVISEFVDQHIKELKKGIINHCFFIAERAIADGVATGRVSSQSGTSEFVGWGNHCINYRVFEDGSLLAFDLSASLNIDNRQGSFDILAIRSSSLEELLSMLNDLYGGEWVNMQNEDR